MHFKMNFSKITKNHFADPEILVGFYVCVRLFLKKKRKAIVGIELARHGAKAQLPKH